MTPRIEANILQQTRQIMTEEIIPHISEQMKEFIRQTVTSEVSQAMSQMQLEPAADEPIVTQTITDDKVLDIEDRLEKCEELGKLHYVRSCEDLKSQGVSKNGEYYVDPDGNGQGEDPILVSCDFEQGTTSVHHNVLNQTEIPRCNDGPGCSKIELLYEAPMSQIRTLVDQSVSCSQEIRFECLLAPLKQYGENFGWWTDYQGHPKYFFDGNSTSNAYHTCACANDCNEDNTDYYGNDIQNYIGFKVSDMSACISECQSHDDCNYWTYRKSTEQCWLKTAKSDVRRGRPVLISGPKNCQSQCIDADEVCNCNAYQNSWASDEGRITSMASLPVKSFNYGPIELEGKDAKIFVGPLICSGKHRIKYLPCKYLQ